MKKKEGKKKHTKQIPKAQTTASFGTFIRVAALL
jgi:hypothetical protein